jgi:hypothetical protein
MQNCNVAKLNAEASCLVARPAPFDGSGPRLAASGGSLDDNGRPGAWTMMMMMMMMMPRASDGGPGCC